MLRAAVLVLPAAAAALLLCTPLRSALAQDQPKRPWKLQADFGLVNTSGNTSTTTLNAGQEGSYTTGAWTLGEAFNAVYGRTGGATSAENYTARLRADYAISPHVGVYLLGGWNRDRFAGIARRFDEGTGLRLVALDRPRTKLNLEAGLSTIQQRPTTGADRNYAAARGAVHIKQMLGEKAYLEQKAEILPNLKTTDDVRINSETSLVAPISGSIAFKAGYVIKFDNVPEPGFGKTDRFLTSGLQVVF